MRGDQDPHDLDRFVRTIDDDGRSPRHFGSSGVTLFGRAGPDEAVFAAVLDRWCAGRPDRAPLDRL